MRGDLRRRRVSTVLQVMLVNFAVWMTLAVFLGVQIHLNSESMGGNAIGLAHSVRVSIQRYLLYAVLALPVVWLCHRFPPLSSRWALALLAHVGGLAGFVFLYALGRTLTGMVVDSSTLEPLPASLDTLLSVARSNLYDQFWMYSGIVFVSLSIEYYRRYRLRELRETRLMRRMAEYELQVLRLQLHPHFLFNAMNGIATLMERDVGTARRMLERLCELLRGILNESTEDEIPLSKELAFVESYVDLERMRFGSRLEVELDVALECLHVPVPSMILQPLVENAIHYGIARRRAGGKLLVRARRVSRLLRISILNDGPDRAAAGSSSGGSGIGLRNARLRLSRLYGQAFSLRFRRRTEGGAEVVMEVPIRTSAGSEETE